MIQRVQDDWQPISCVVLLVVLFVLETDSVGSFSKCRMGVSISKLHSIYKSVYLDLCFVCTNYLKLYIKWQLRRPFVNRDAQEKTAGRPNLACFVVPLTFPFPFAFFHVMSFECRSARSHG